MASAVTSRLLGVGRRGDRLGISHAEEAEESGGAENFVAMIGLAVVTLASALDGFWRLM